MSMRSVFVRVIVTAAVLTCAESLCSAANTALWDWGPNSNGNPNGNWSTGTGHWDCVWGSSADGGYPDRYWDELPDLGASYPNATINMDAPDYPLGLYINGTTNYTVNNSGGTLYLRRGFSHRARPPRLDTRPTMRHTAPGPSSFRWRRRVPAAPISRHRFPSTKEAAARVMSPQHSSSISRARTTPSRFPVLSIAAAYRKDSSSKAREHVHQRDDRRRSFLDHEWHRHPDLDRREQLRQRHQRCQSRP